MNDVRPLTLKRLNLVDYTLDNNLALECLLDSGRPHDKPKNGVGTLDLLPLEVLQAVLVLLDLRALTDFRMVNRQGSVMVASVPQYRSIITHARIALLGALSIGAGQWITCEALYNTICTAECETCGDFGGYIYLLTCKRVCFLCLSENEAYLPYDITAKKFNGNLDALKTLPWMRSIPGTYSPHAKKRKKRFRLADSERIRHHGLANAMKKRGFDGASGNPLRFMAIVQVPALDPSADEVDEGFYCVACQKSYCGRSQHFRRRFTLKSFRLHLEECGFIVNGKHHKANVL